MKNKILPPPILMPCEVKGSFTVSPTSYTFKPTDKIVINYSHTSKIDYGYLYGLTDDVVFSESSTTNTITFPSNSKEGTYNCYIGTYENATDWIESNRFTITIGNSTPPPTDNAPTVNSISDIATKVDQTVAITYIATDDNGIVKHELSQNGGSSFSAINPTKNGNTYTHTLSYSSIGNRQCKIRVADAKNQSATSNNFTISVTDSTPSDIPVTSVVVSPTSKSLTVGASFNITHTVNPNNATNKNVTWSSGNTNVASVVNGLVRGITKGSTTITCRSASDSSKYATCSVTVTDNSSGSGLQAIWNNYTSSLQALRESMHNANTKIAQVKADNSTETSKTYTEAKIEVVNNAIKEKVSQTTYDENNRVVNQKFVDVEKNVNGINQTVGEIEGKYVDKTTLEQTKDEFNFKFENSGVGNLVSNPNFRGVWKNWIPDGHTSVYQNNASSDYGRIGVSTNVKNRYVYIKSDTLMVVDGGVDYSFSAWDASDVTPYNVQHPNLSVTINHTVDFLDENKNKISHLDVIKKNHTNGWTDERGKVHAIFKTPNNCRYVNYRHHAIFSGGASNAQLNLYLAYVCISRGYSKGYMPHTNEIYSNVTTIDGNGVEINHINGATSRMDHEAIEFTASNGAKTLRIKDGGLNFHTWQVPAEMVGFIKPTLMEENKSYNGVILSTYGEGDFVGIGNSKSTDENNWVATPSLMIIHHNNVDGYDAGTNFVNNDVFFKTQCNVNHNMAFNQYSGKLIFNNKFSDVNLKHKMFNISSTNEMCIVGKPSLILGYINSSGSPISALKILDTGWGVNDSNWNWNNKALQNANLTYSLEPQSEQLRSMRKAINKAYSQKSIEDRIIRHLCTTETSTGNDTSVMVEIPQLLAENLELDYHVNISKMSFGDYRVVEKTPYYFILESEKPNFRFTYEIVGREVEKAKDIKFISSIPYVELENNLVDNSGYDMSYIDLTESN